MVCKKILPLDLQQKTSLFFPSKSLYKYNTACELCVANLQNKNAGLNRIKERMLLFTFRICGKFYVSKRSCINFGIIALRVKPF